MNAVEMKELVIGKVEEMEAMLNDLLKSDVSENTKRTQKFQRTTAIHNLKVLAAVLSQTKEVTLTEEEQKWFNSMVTLTRERKAKYTIEVHEGDNIMQLMQKYENVKDVYHKLMRAAEEKGLKADFVKQVFVKA